MSVSLVLLAASLIVWCVLHSLLADDRAKEAIGRLVMAGPTGGRVRLVYNMVAAATLAGPLYYYWYLRTAPGLAHPGRLIGSMVLDWPPRLAPVQLVIWIVAGLLFLATARRYDMLQFIGLRGAPSNDSAPRLVTDGTLSFVRHPWYLAGLMIMWARDLGPADLVLNSVFSAYLVVGSFSEERKLIAVYGDEYRAYQRRVSMLIPIKWVRAMVIRALAPRTR